MKKTLLLLASAVLALGLFACSGGSEGADAGGGSASSGEVAVNPDDITTLGDALAVETDSYASTYNETVYVYTFNNGEVPMRATATLSAEDYEALNAIDFMDEDAHQKTIDATSSIPLDSLEDLSDNLLTQEDLDALVGKTGQDLIDEGWVVDMLYSLDGDVQYVMDNTDFSYLVTFDPGDQEVTEESDPNEVVPGMTVTAAEYYGFCYSAIDLS